MLKVLHNFKDICWHTLKHCTHVFCNGNTAIPILLITKMHFHYNNLHIVEKEPC